MRRARYYSAYALAIRVFELLVFSGSASTVVGPDIASPRTVNYSSEGAPVGVIRGCTLMLAARHLTQHTPR